jgi:tRNA G18 (ribose-2'-O)-methylase SpoU
MSRHHAVENGPRGFFGIGIWHGKCGDNVGTLWRSAFQLGASFIYTIGRRYPRQSADTVKAYRHVPLYEYDAFDPEMIPLGCVLVGVEMGGDPLPEFTHPMSAIYMLGAEDSGLSKEMAGRCHRVVSIPALRTASYNVAMAGTLVMYDRMAKQLERDA